MSEQKERLGWMSRRGAAVMQRWTMTSAIVSLKTQRSQWVCFMLS